MEPLRDHRDHRRAARRGGVRLAIAAALVLACGAVTAAFAQASGYFIQADTVRGAIGAQGAVCVINATFMLGEQVVFRAYVYDAATGEQLTADQIEELGVQVYGVIDGERVAELEFIPHPPGTEEGELFWAGAYQLPTDHPTGNFAWSVEVEDEAGNTAAYLPMGHTIGLGTLVILPPSGTPAAPGGPPGTGDAPAAPGGEEAPPAAPGGGEDAPPAAPGGGG